MPAIAVSLCALIKLSSFAQVSAPAPAPETPEEPAAAPAEAEANAPGPDEKPPGYAAPTAPVEAAAPAVPNAPAPVATAAAPTRAETQLSEPDLSRHGALRHGGPGITDSEGWRFEFHGFIRAPMRVGLGRRTDPAPGQGERTFHYPVVPDDQYLSWQYTAHNPRDWAELYFSVRNAVVAGTISIQSYNFTDAAWNNTDAQLGIAEGYVTLTPLTPWENVRFQWKVGAFSNRYGAPGRYDGGPYDTYLFGHTHAMGEAARVELDLEQPVTLYFEHGIGTKRPHPSSDNRARFTLLNHAHAGAKLFDNRLDVGVHYLSAWAVEEDRVGTAAPNLPDGRISVYGPDVRLEAGRFGYLYAGFSHIAADDAVTVAPAIEVLHSFGGGEFELGVTDNYLDGPNKASNGNGSVNSVLGHYEFSLSTFLQGEEEFWGEGPDVIASIYGMLNAVSSDDPDMDGVKKLKYGVDLLANPVSWFGGAVRYDRVQPNSRRASQSFSILSPRIVFRTAFASREEISIQYSRYFYNQRRCPEGGDPTRCVQPPVGPAIPEGFGTTTENQDEGNRGAPSAIPDKNVFTLSATMWW